MKISCLKSKNDLKKKKKKKKNLHLHKSFPSISFSLHPKEYIDHFIPNPPEWSAVRISDYNYGHLNIMNKTQIYWEQVSGQPSTFPITVTDISTS